jgi:predicted kinase
MATLHLIVGLPCSGKTTYAKKLELEKSALRLTPDEWHTRLFGQDFGLDLEHPEHDARHGLIESMMWDVAARALQLGTNVILDFGFWGKSEREDYRARAAQVEANTIIHFLNVSEQELLARLEIRNANLPEGTFQIPAAKLREWMQIFQAPTADELEL